MHFKNVFFFILTLHIFFVETVFAQVEFKGVIKNNFIVAAHRGDHTEAPENTLAAYKNAIENGVDFIEIDLRTSKDGQFIIMHNPDIEHMTGVKGKVNEMQFDSLRKIMIKDPNHPEWGLHQIPTFNEVLKLSKDKINIYLDFKDASVKKAFAEIVENKMENNVVVYINSKNQFKEWRGIAPKMPLMISLPKKVSNKKQMLRMINHFKMDILDGNYAEYNEKTIKAAFSKNIPIWADIQSKDEGPEQWGKAIKIGLKGLQTDHPAALIKYLISLGIR